MAAVTIFEHANFEGRSQELPEGHYDDALRQITIGNDTLSSVRVPKGLVVRLYEHYHFQGRFIDLRKDTRAVSPFWNDRPSSIIVYKETEQPPVIKEVMIFEHANYEGKAQLLKPGKYNTAQILIGDKMLSSALIPYGMSIRLFEQLNLQGESITLREDTPAIKLEWNDRASSMIVESSPVAFWRVSNNSIGILGESSESNGVRGISHASDQAAVVGKNDNNGPGVLGFSGGVGVWGESTDWLGIFGYSKLGHGVWGESPNGSGVVGVTKRWHGVFGVTESIEGGVGVWGEHKTTGTGVVGLSASGVGVHARGGRLAGLFEGDIEVTGDIRLLNADCAEDFTIGLDSAVDPGTVMVVGSDGELFPCQQAYDKRVAGVISGAGDFKPALVLDKQQSDRTRQPIALVGKVFCKVDTQYGAIAVGDLLTTSPTPGHAMKAADPTKAFGAVIGKALRPLKDGQGLIPILIALQ
jgi:hypothetical protein